MSCCRTKWAQAEDERKRTSIVLELAELLNAKRVLQENDTRYGLEESLQKVSRDIGLKLVELDEFVLKRCKLVNAGGRGIRSDQQNNVEKVVKLLFDYTLAMLKCNDCAKRTAMRREIDSGKFIAEHAEVRPGTVGKILNLKGKNRNPDAHAQLFFQICRDEDTFRVFEEFAYAQKTPIDQLSADTVCLRFGSVLAAQQTRSLRT